ncbi:MAG: SDR family oxidoreductase [Oscillospiraceae bacterium]
MLPGEMTWYAGDVGDPAAAVGMVKKAVETFGRLDVAVNCAGVMDDNTAIADMSDEMLEKTVPHQYVRPDVRPARGM